MPQTQSGQKYSGVPANWIPIARFRDKTANVLTRSIIAFLTFEGHHSERISIVSRQINGKCTAADACK
ncbi:hypothetical protein OCK74_20460 [Chitinophagaceae bacterium LB-8]|uniref:Uncharacterized protein n=1 Tax=Paraflavisolibacter caeni TaxID=2982496 RepID=A0A9X2XZ14_9BACT|nr:hypothetical protein [Paraflavisolibacter caeni]MCU7551506.1 hypothetical protein [Paraflavisolibacter caeni]